MADKRDAVYLSDIIERIHPKLLDKDYKRVNRLMLNRILNLFLDELGDLLVEGESISLSKFGTFTPVQHSARINTMKFRTNVRVFIPRYKRVSFRSHKKLQNKINGIFLLKDEQEA